MITLSVPVRRIARQQKLMKEVTSPGYASTMPDESEGTILIRRCGVEMRPKSFPKLRRHDQPSHQAAFAKRSKKTSRCDRTVWQLAFHA